MLHLVSYLATLGAPTWGDAPHYAVLIAGSSGYWNYRHQADVCHAYQILINKGMPADHIITLAVDDVASSSMNPFPGKLFNKPTPQGTPGTDVYANCKIDYSGDQVTPEIFQKVLMGDDSAGGPVLKSTSADRVFVNFVDHGGVGIIGFPKTTMHAKDLIKTLQYMSDNAMYKELVFYMEACESGSMFQELPTGIHMYATTAANAHESSWGTYCMPNDKVDGTELHSCLGDLYSVTWMEDSDALQPGETIATQTATVMQLVNKSHVQEFGDKTIKSEEVVAFEGKGDSSSNRLPAPAPTAAEIALREQSAIRSEDAALASVFALYNADMEGASEQLLKMVRTRDAAKARFSAIAHAVTGVKASALPPRNGALDLDCHYDAHRAYTSACGEWDEMEYRHSSTLAKLCDHTNGASDPIVAAIRDACPAKASVQ